MHCEEDAEPRCVFDVPAPWLVVARGTTLEGLPLNRIGQQPLIELARREPSRSLGIIGLVFAGDGRRGIVANLEEEHLLSYQLLHFGAGLPSTVEPLRDVPNLVGLFSAADISADSEYALIEDTYTGTYLVSLSERREPTVLYPVDQFGEGTFCDDPRSYFLESSAGTSLFTLGPDGVSSSVIEGDAMHFSQRRFLVWSLSEPERVLVRSCSAAAAELVLVGARNPWLGPGDTLLVERDAGGMELHALGDASEPDVIWSTSELQLSAPSFSSDGRHLVGTVDSTVYLVDLSAADNAPVALDLPEGAALASGLDSASIVGERALLVWLPGQGEARQLFWQPLDATQERQLLVDDPSGGRVRARVSDGYPNRPLISVIEGNREHLLSVRLDSATPQLEPIATFDSGISETTWAPDGSGIAVSVATRDLYHDVFFVPLDSGGAPGPAQLVASDVTTLSFQPWP
jgi:hypothetical protein